MWHTHTQDVSHTLLMSAFMDRNHAASGAVQLCESVSVGVVAINEGDHTHPHTLCRPAVLGDRVLVLQTETSHWSLADVQQPIAGLCQLELKLWQGERFIGLVCAYVTLYDTTVAKVCVFRHCHILFGYGCMSVCLLQLWLLI